MTDRVIMGANWYVDRLNCRLGLVQCRMPRLTKAKDAFVAGGGFFRLAIPYEIEELEAQFSMRGSHEQVRKLFGYEPGEYTTFYYYERLRDIMAGRNVGRVVMLKGLVNEVEQSQVRGKKGEDVQYTIGSIVLYHDIHDGQTVHKFDFRNNQLVMDGVDYSLEHNQLVAA
ncbi:phage major tail tube protein [Methylobacterium aquaticum]|uniref:phage major tail tube protein n=1 Tax=Methylobacterium aquaticum TaxID=270351 RepID=UPI001FEEAB50|nr:phage major tail tube protein [Methylobacterium aquaticum]